MSKSKFSFAQAILVLLAIAIVVVAMWYGVLDAPRTKLKAKARARDDFALNLDKARKQIADAAKTKLMIDAATERLHVMETRMPVGDAYRWLIKAFLDFPAATNVVLANIDPPHISESTFVPKVPYKIATFTLTGSAYYHSFGTFLAALENDFPHMRVRKLDLTPTYPGEADSGEAEKLTFQLEMIAFFKPAESPGPAQLSLGPENKRPN
jgi:Tfp pilus assembly protein PilO